MLIATNVVTLVALFIVWRRYRILLKMLSMPDWQKEPLFYRYRWLRRR